MSGDLTPGDQLQSTAQLTSHYGTSHSTVQKALGDLKDEGYLRSEVGKGVYVQDRQPLIVRVGTYFGPSPGGYSYRILGVTEEASVPADAAAGIGAATAVLRHRLMLHNGRAVELSWSYYPSDIATGTALARRPKIPGGAPRVLADLGYPQRRFVDRVSARMPTTEELEGLELPDDVPVIRQLRVVYSDDDRPVEVGIQIKGSNLYELEYWENVAPS